MVPGSQIKLVLAENSLESFPGCNELRGAFEVAAGRLTLSDPTLTEKGCAQTRLMDQDQWFSSWLSSGVDISNQSPTGFTLSGDGVSALFVRSDG